MDHHFGVCPVAHAVGNARGGQRRQNSRPRPRAGAADEDNIPGGNKATPSRRWIKSTSSDSDDDGSLLFSMGRLIMGRDPREQEKGRIRCILAVWSLCMMLVVCIPLSYFLAYPPPAADEDAASANSNQTLLNVAAGDGPDVNLSRLLDDQEITADDLAEVAMDGVFIATPVRVSLSSHSGVGFREDDLDEPPTDATTDGYLPPLPQEADQEDDNVIFTDEPRPTPDDERIIQVPITANKDETSWPGDLAAAGFFKNIAIILGTLVLLTVVGCACCCICGVRVSHALFDDSAHDSRRVYRHDNNQAVLFPPAANNYGTAGDGNSKVYVQAGEPTGYGSARQPQPPPPGFNVHGFYPGHNYQQQSHPYPTAV